MASPTTVKKKKKKKWSGQVPIADGAVEQLRGVFAAIGYGVVFSAACWSARVFRLRGMSEGRILKLYKKSE